MEKIESEEYESIIPMPAINNRNCQEIIRTNLCSFINRAKEIHLYAQLIDEKTVNNTVQYAIIHSIKLMPKAKELLKKPLTITQEIIQPYTKSILDEITNYEPIKNDNQLIKTLANELANELYKTN